MSWLYAALGGVSGYGVAARRLVAGLRASGEAVTDLPFGLGSGWGLGFEPAAPIAPADTVVAHLMPEYYPRLRAAAPGARFIAHTVWETDRLPAHWPELLEQADRIVVPCRWNVEVFGAAVSTPVDLVPHVAIDVVRTTSDTWAGIGPETFVCYSIASWTGRKSPWFTVAAFIEAFQRRDDVVLVLVTSKWDETSGRSTVAAMASLLAGNPDPPRVVLVNRELDDHEMAALHTRADCFVSLCRSEGWGLGAFDAGAYGNEVIITGFGGQLDYLDGEVAALVDHRLVAVANPGPGSYTSDQTWAEPSVSHGAALLRDAYERRDTTRGARLSERILSRYAPDRVAEEFIRACQVAHGNR